MTEIEQLRKEVNELRERLARLEAGQYARPIAAPHTPVWPSNPHWINPGDFPPGTVIC